MAVPRKLVIVPNAATRELWRIAESGDIDELDGVLPQADINARNEHGMTALMRAAYHGRVQMVRVLLDHGADPNVTRNDNFTALSLAAFFGHAEIVDMLMGHGARADVATRFGTSPHQWARARSFGDVARCLEKRREDRKQPVIEDRRQSVIEDRRQPVIEEQPVFEEPVSSSTPQPLVVRTLKDPPEIWDLVQEAPRNFNASSAFMARLHSTKGGFFTLAVVLLLVIGAGIGAVIYFKDRIPSAGAPAATAAAATAPSSAVTTPSQPNDAAPATNNAATELNSASAETPSVVVSEPVSGEINTTVPRRSRPVARPRANASDLTVEPDTVQAAAPAAIEPPKVNLPAANEAEPKKTSAPLSPQVIAPPKTAQPKAKVIQWP
jgi:hypothetical protein